MLEAGSWELEAGSWELEAVPKSTVLIVDDEAGVRSSLSGVLRDEGYAVDAVESGEACLERVARTPYDVVVLDIWLPGIDGLATLARLRARRADQRARADLRRERHRQGAGRPQHPRDEPPAGRAVHRGQLRRHSRRADRERAVRPRPRRLHRRARGSPRQV